MAESAAALAGFLVKLEQPGEKLPAGIRTCQRREAVIAADEAHATEVNMITLGHLSLSDRSGFAWDRLSIDAALTSQGHIALSIEQGIEPDRPWGSVVTLIPTLSLADFRTLRDLLCSVLFAAEACLDAASQRPPSEEDSSEPIPPEA